MIKHRLVVLPSPFVMRPIAALLTGLGCFFSASQALAICNANQWATGMAYAKIANPRNDSTSDLPFPPNFPDMQNPAYGGDNLNTGDCAFQAITPDQIFAMGSMATRVNGGKISPPGNYFGLNQRKRGGGAGDLDLSGLNVWSNIDSDFGDRHSDFNQTGFEFDNHHFVFGADYRLQERWVAGGSFAYRHNTANHDAGRGETVNDSYTGMLYTTYQLTEAAHLEATASYGGFNYDTTRNINFLGSSSVAQASTQGGQYAFSWGGGYDFTMQKWTLSPYARGDYMNLDIDAYSESGSPFAVRFGKQNIESLISTVGVQTAYTIGVPWGVLIPQLRGEWHHQFMDGARQVEAGFVADPSNQFIMTSSGPTRDYYTFGAEVSSVFAGGMSAFLAYETLQSYSTINSNKLMLGARLEF